MIAESVVRAAELSQEVTAVESRELCALNDKIAVDAELTEVNGCCLLNWLGSLIINSYCLCVSCVLDDSFNHLHLIQVKIEMEANELDANKVETSLKKQVRH